MLRQKREKSGTGICHVMQGQESKACPCDSMFDAAAKKNQEEKKGRRKMITNE